MGVKLITWRERKVAHNLSFFSFPSINLHIIYYLFIFYLQYTCFLVLWSRNWFAALNQGFLFISWEVGLTKHVAILSPLVNICVPFFVNWAFFLERERDIRTSGLTCFPTHLKLYCWLGSKGLVQQKPCLTVRSEDWIEAMKTTQAHKLLFEYLPEEEPSICPWSGTRPATTEITWKTTTDDTLQVP